MIEVVLPLVGMTAVTAVALSGLKIVRPTHAGLIERLGKYKRMKGQGITWIIPFVEQIYRVNITEQMTDISTQEIITKDNLNAMIDLQVYYKVQNDETHVKASLYNAFNFQSMIVALARTTMRDVIGTKNFVEVNSQRNILNTQLRETMQIDVTNWGIDLVRVELKEISPPKDVQDVMNKVLKAENEKKAAIDFATAAETEADGTKRAEIKKAEGIRQATILKAEADRQQKILLAEGVKQQKILEAEGEATAIKTVAVADAERIKVVNQSAKTYFKDEAQQLKLYEVTQASLQNNAKIILTEKGISPVLVVSDQNVFPLPTKVI